MILVFNDCGIRYLIRQLHKKFKPFSKLYKFEKQKSVVAFMDEIQQAWENTGIAYSELKSWDSTRGRTELIELAPRHYDVIEDDQEEKDDEGD
jgi:hypothetical protein